MKQPIAVPIRIDAMWSDGKTELSPPTVDFSALEKAVPSEGENFSNTNPWLGDTVENPSNELAPLPQGVHLHWTLPEGLRHGTTVYVFDYAVFNELVQQGMPCALVDKLKAAVVIEQEYTRKDVEGILTALAGQSGKLLSDADFRLSKKPKTYKHLISSDDKIKPETHTPNLSWDPIFVQLYTPMIFKQAAKMKLPPVPDRWLIVREDKNTTNSVAWVLESDRLTKAAETDETPLAPAGTGPLAVPAQFSAKKIRKWDKVTKAEIAHFLGFHQEASGWTETNDLQRLAPLTATGYGLADFSMFYQNCQNVFGFHDSTASEDVKYQYTVIGWFADANNDPLSSDYNIQPWATNHETTEKRCEALGWSVDGGTDWSNITSSVYSCSITVNSADCTVQSETDLNDIEVAIGNTAGEALAAYLADGDSTPTLGVKPETIINAAQAGVLRQVLEQDGATLVENTLYQQGFQPINQGWVWQITFQPPKDAGLGSTPDNPTQTEIPMSEALDTALSELNAAQMAFDQAQSRQEAERHLVFADWCRTLHLGTDVDKNNENVFPNGGTQNSANSSNLLDLSGTMVNKSAESITKASLGGADLDNMPTYKRLQQLYLCYKAVQSELSTLSDAHQYVLRRQPAPRFWQAHDPVVMMCGTTDDNELTTFPASQQQGKLVLNNTYTPAGTAPSYLPDSWANNKNVPASTYLAGIVSQSEPIDCASSWRPLSLYWQASYRPFKDTGSITAKKSSDDLEAEYTNTPYKTDFITSQFKPGATDLDLVPQQGIDVDSEVQPSDYFGRIHLSPHALGTLHQQILQLTGQKQDPPADAKDLELPGALGQGNTQALIEKAYASKATTLSQTLHGFHDRLRMMRPIPQVSVFDCNYVEAQWNRNGNTGKKDGQTFDSCSQSFYNQIGNQKHTSPQSSDLYQPIRAGKCELTELRIVDAFGQIRQWNQSTDNTYISETLVNETKANDSDAAPAFLLSPRLAQPSRLLFRWLAANEKDQVESTQAPHTTPIFGWLVLNRVDETIMVFAQDGTLVGWVPAAGGTMTYMEGKSEGDLSDPYLSQVATQLQASKSTFFERITEALLTINPQDHRQHANQSVLASRPLALTRARLQLELLGTPTPHQGYAGLGVQSLDNNNNPTLVPGTPYIDRPDCDFTAVEFPVRLGEVGMDDDGLLGYWTTSNQTISAGCTFVGEGTAAAPAINLTSAGDGSTAEVLLLMDPRAPVHANPGILPIKDIKIPPNMYAKAVQNMRYVMRTRDVLTPADSYLMPLPGQAAGWQWFTADDLTPQSMNGKIDDQVHTTDQPAVLRTGYLQTKEVS